MIKKTLRWIGLVIGGLSLIGLAVAWAVNEIRPVGQEGETADMLALRMEKSLGIEQWEETGAIRFEFVGGFQHLWDRERPVVDLVRHFEGLKERVPPQPPHLPITGAGADGVLD